MNKKQYAMILVTAMVTGFAWLASGGVSMSPSLTITVDAATGTAITNAATPIVNDGVTSANGHTDGATNALTTLIGGKAATNGTYTTLSAGTATFATTAGTATFGTTAGTATFATTAGTATFATSAGTVGETTNIVMTTDTGTATFSFTNGLLKSITP